MYYVKDLNHPNPSPSTLLIPEDTYYPPCDLEESDPTTILDNTTCASFPAQALTYFTCPATSQITYQVSSYDIYGRQDKII